MAYDSLSVALSNYHSQVSEFAEELLVACNYYSSDANYWVESGLVSDSAAQEALFSAAESAFHPSKASSPQEAASLLFHSHLVFVRSFRQGILSSQFNGDLPDPLTFEERHQQVTSEATQDTLDWSKKGKQRV